MTVVARAGDTVHSFTQHLLGCNRLFLWSVRGDCALPASAAGVVRVMWQPRRRDVFHRSRYGVGGRITDAGGYQP